MQRLYVQGEQPVIDAGLVFRGILPLTLYTGTIVGLNPSIDIDFTSLITLGGMVLAMTGVAYVMRSDVRRHDKDLKELVAATRELSSVMVAMQTHNIDRDRRLEKLENHNDDCSNYRRRRDDSK